MQPSKVTPFRKPEAPAQRPIPQSKAAEHALIGCLLKDKGLIQQAVNRLEPGDFFFDQTRAMYRAILELHLDKVKADSLTIKARLESAGMWGNEDGKINGKILNNFIFSIPRLENAGEYILIIRKMALLRRIMDYGARVAALGLKDLDAGDALEVAQSELQELSSWWTGGNSDGYFLRHEDTGRFLSETKEQKKDKGKKLQFGWRVFDGYKDGATAIEPAMLLSRYTLTTFLANTSHGKTIIAEQISSANARAGANVLFFHNELSQAQLEMRRLSRMTGIEYWKQEQDELDKEERNLLLDQQAVIHKWPGRVDFCACPSWSSERIANELRARNQMLEVSTGRGYDLVILDYLNRTGQNPALRNANRTEWMGRNVQDFSDVINELGVAGVMFVQVHRAEGDKAKPPELQSGLDTGQIERLSNQVIGVFVEFESNDLGKGFKPAKFRLLKSTFGSKQELNLAFVEGRYEFIDGK